MNIPGYSSDVNNAVAARNIFPSMKGATIGTRSSPNSPYTTGGYKAGNPGGNAGAGATDAGSNSVGGGSPAPAGGVLGRPVSWWLILAALLFSLMWAAKRFGNQADEFKNVKLSVYNILVITLAAMIGRAALRVIFNTVQVPGLTTFINAA